MDGRAQVADQENSKFSGLRAPATKFTEGLRSRPWPFCFVRKGGIVTDEQLVAAFESTDLGKDEFTHVTHVRVAWWYLQQASFAKALLRFSTALQRHAAAHGAPASVTKLFAKPSPLLRYYTAETLASDRARRSAVMPGLAR